MISNLGFSRAITQPATGLACLASILIACPTPTRAAPPPVGSEPPPVTPSTNPAVPVGSELPPVRPAINQVGPSATDYLLGGGDRIKITILDVPEYSGEYQVPPGGEVYVPLIGSVSVQGLTQAQAADLISAKYARFLKRPLVTVSLVAARPINFAVAGEVNAPGSYTTSAQAAPGLAGGGVQFPTVVNAIQQAQGVTLAANITQVQLRRQQGVGLPPITITVDLRNLVQNGTLQGDLSLRDGDTIFVPTATATNLRTIRQLATANFAAPANLPRTVTVVGEVNRPGPYVVIGGETSGTTTLSAGGTIAQGANNITVGLPTVTRALQTAGGITSSADIRNIEIRRFTKAGVEEVIHVNLLKLVATGDITQDTLVQEGDSIVVPRATNLTPAEQTQIASTNLSPDTIQVNVIGEVRNPGQLKVPPNTPLNQALLQAGGFNNGRANRKAVDLIRLNPNGTVTKRLVRIDLTNSLNERTNPSLRNNDIILVSRNGLAKTGDTLNTIFAPFGNLFGLASIINTFK
ncbi:MAG: SLBB domain-containing protein [Chroococcidiopsidaceae cyanobacterium CP_BM_ER_R8_30]|nr:SLBB domain-containing protein [Chroococcidiopsidaceae cyanobacterium CP_BM_ER_R8_30]